MVDVFHTRSTTAQGFTKAFVRAARAHAGEAGTRVSTLETRAEELGVAMDVARGVPLEDSSAASA